MCAHFEPNPIIMVGRDESDGLADGVPEAFDGSLSRLSQPRLELGESVLNGIAGWAVGREMEKSRARGCDQARTFGPSWLGRLSMITTSPSRNSGKRTFST